MRYLSLAVALTHGGCRYRPYRGRKRRPRTPRQRRKRKLPRRPPTRRRWSSRLRPPAKELFGAAKSPAPMAARSIGFYAKGCLAGGAALPIDGPAWQAMRLSRNRNWGHPELVALVREARPRGPEAGRLAGSAGRRPLSAARRADADRTRQPPGRARCRHLADAHAQSSPQREGARGPVGHLDAGGTTRSRSIPRSGRRAHVRLIKRAASYAPCGAHLRAPGHQEGAVRRYSQR